MSILALDISLNTGWAYQNGDRITHGTTRFEGYKGNRAKTGIDFAHWLNKQITEKEPIKIVIEKSFFHKLRPNHNVDFILNAMNYEVCKSGYYNNIPIIEYSPLTIKKFMCGTARVGKAEVIEAVKSLGYAPANDHEADAIACLLLHLERQKNG